MKKFIIFIFVIFFAGCNSTSNLKIGYAGKPVKIKDDTVSIAQVDNLLRVESKNEYVVHLPNSNDWNFIFDDGKNIFTAESKFLGFDVSFYKVKESQANVNQEKYLANIGENFASNGMKLGNARMVKVDPTKNKVLSFSHSLLEGNYITWFFYTLKQSKKNNDIYYLSIRKTNPPVEHLEELRFSLNHLLANLFYLIEK